MGADNPLLLTSAVRRFNPDTGTSFVRSYAGTDAQMASISNYWENLNAVDNTPLGYGYKTDTTKTEAGTFLTVTVPEGILYTERWNLDTEFASVPIWWNEKVKNYIPATASLDLTSISDLTSYLFRIALIQKSVSLILSGTDFTNLFVGANPPDGAVDLGPLTKQELDVMMMMVREGEATEWKRPILKRCRVMPTIAVSTRTRLIGPPQLYSTAGISNVFGMPSDIYNQAVTVEDDLPTAAPNTVWSWKFRQDNSDTLLGSGKVQELRDWVFGRWSTITHTFVE